MLARNDFDCILIDWVLESDRIVAFYDRVRSLVPQGSVFLFTGIASSQEVKEIISAIGEEKVAPLSLDTLIAELFQESNR